MKKLLLCAWLAAAGAAVAAPATYLVDPTHTYPSFEADHMGLSMWRGKFNKNAGTVTLDKAAGQGRVEITIDATSIDFGLDIMNSKAREPDLFDTAKYPQVRYKGRLEGFTGGAPSRVVGELTLHGVTKPVQLMVDARWQGDRIDVAGTAPIVLADYGIATPQTPLVSADGDGSFELQLVFVPAA